MGTFLANLLPARSWPSAEARVDSCQWLRLHNHLGGVGGHYQIKFTYLAGGEENHGEFCHDGSQKVPPYMMGERFSIQFDPKRPKRYHVNGAERSYEKLEAIVVVTVFALIAGYFLYAY
jgi:hypothetical protein